MDCIELYNPCIKKTFIRILIINLGFLKQRVMIHIYYKISIKRSFFLMKHNCSERCSMFTSQVFFTQQSHVMFLYAQDTKAPAQ